MLESTKMLITQENNDLFQEFTALLPSLIRYVFPVVGSIALIFFSVKVFRKITNV